MCINELDVLESVTRPLSSEVVTTVAEVAIVNLAVTKKLASSLAGTIASIFKLSFVSSAVTRIS